MRAVRLLLLCALASGCGVFERPIANSKGACISVTDVPPGVTGVRVVMPNIDELSAQRENESTWVFCIDEEEAQRTNFTSIFAARIIMLTGQVFITFEQGPYRTTFVNERQFSVFKNRTRNTTFQEWTNVEEVDRPRPSGDADPVPWGSHVEKAKRANS